MNRRVFATIFISVALILGLAPAAHAGKWGTIYAKFMNSRTYCKLYIPTPDEVSRFSPTPGHIFRRQVTAVNVPSVRGNCVSAVGKSIRFRIVMRLQYRTSAGRWIDWAERGTFVIGTKTFGPFTVSGMACGWLNDGRRDPETTWRAIGTVHHQRTSGIPGFWGKNVYDGYRSISVPLPAYPCSRFT